MAIIKLIIQRLFHFHLKHKVCLCNGQSQREFVSKSKTELTDDRVDERILTIEINDKKEDS